MQRSAGTSRMVPDPQTAKVGNGKSVLKSNLTAGPPFGNPMQACEGYRKCIELPCHCEERSDVAISWYELTHCCALRWMIPGDYHGLQASLAMTRKVGSLCREIAPQGYFLALRAQGATPANAGSQ